MRINRMLQMIVVVGFALAIAAASAKADPFTVTLNTSPLSGTQVLAFLFNDGDGVTDNSAFLSNFAFGGGGALGTPDFLGSTGVNGNLTSGIAMDDSGFTAIFTQEFTPGASLSFLLNSTNNFAGGTPDTFAMAVCDTSFNCYSDDLNTGALLVLSLTGGTLSTSSFTLNGASQQKLDAPVVTTGTTGVPEPGSLLLLASGLAGCFLLTKRGS